MCVRFIGINKANVSVSVCACVCVCARARARVARAAALMTSHENTERMAHSSFGNDLEQRSISLSEVSKLLHLLMNVCQGLEWTSEIVGALEITDNRLIVRLCTKFLVF